MELPDAVAVQRSLDAHGDALWAVAAGATSSRADAVEVVVGALRSAPPGPGLLAAAARLSRPAPTVVPTVGLTRLDRAAPEDSLLAALDRMLPPQRDAQVLIRLAGIAPDAAAAALGLSHRAVRRALRAALPEHPPAPPLPADVRDQVLVRALQPGDTAPTVAVGRRRSPRPLVAATVVAVLVVGAGVVALTRPDPPPTAAPAPDSSVADASSAASRARATADRELAARAGIPASGDLTVDQHLARCANAVATSGSTADYPPSRGWTTGTSQVGATGITSTVSDAFVCSTTPTTVYVSATAGVRVGQVQLVRAGPGQLGVLNPRGVSVTLSALRPQTDPSSQISSEKVQLVGVFGESAPFGLAVGGPGLPLDGRPLPEPEPTAVQLVDNRISPPDRTSTAGARLGRCLASPFGDLTPDPDAWNPTTAGTVDGTAIVVAHAFGMAGVCAERDGRRVFTSFPVDDPVPVGALSAVTQIGSVGGDPLSYTVFSVDARAVRLEVTGARLPVQCLVASGVGVCVRASGVVDPAVLRAFDATGALVAGPGPLS